MYYTIYSVHNTPSIFSSIFSTDFFFQYISLLVYIFHVSLMAVKVLQLISDFYRCFNFADSIRVATSTFIMGGGEILVWKGRWGGNGGASPPCLNFFSKWKSCYKDLKSKINRFGSVSMQTDLFSYFMACSWLYNKLYKSFLWTCVRSAKEKCCSSWVLVSYFPYFKSIYFLILFLASVRP